MSVWTGWDPLEEIIVGDCYSPGDMDWVLPAPARDNFNIILKETREDLDYLANYLKSMGVIVHRPIVTAYKQSVELENFNVLIPAAPIVPRDQYLVYGNTIYQTYTSMPDRYVDSINYYSVFKQLYDNNHNWISMPPPALSKLSEGDKWWINGEDIYKSMSDKLLWHTATIFKAGDSIIYNNKGPGTPAGLQWFKQNCPNTKFIENDSRLSKGWGHIDHGFFMTDDNTVLCSSTDWVPSILKNKKVIEIGQYFQRLGVEKLTDDYTATAGKFSPEWLEKWLLEWKGYAQAVNFDTNVLVVDSHNVIFSHYHKELFSFLKNLGITGHVCQQRHGIFWEAGVHCLTLDIKRTGNKRKII